MGSAASSKGQKPSRAGGHPVRIRPPSASSARPPAPRPRRVASPLEPERLLDDRLIHAAVRRHRPPAWRRGSSVWSYRADIRASRDASSQRAGSAALPSSEVAIAVPDPIRRHVEHGPRVAELHAVRTAPWRCASTLARRRACPASGPALLAFKVLGPVDKRSHRFKLGGLLLRTPTLAGGSNWLATSAVAGRKLSPEKLAFGALPGSRSDSRDQDQAPVAQPADDRGPVVLGDREGRSAATRSIVLERWT